MNQLQTAIVFDLRELPVVKLWFDVDVLTHEVSIDAQEDEKHSWHGGSCHPKCIKVKSKQLTALAWSIIDSA